MPWEKKTDVQKSVYATVGAVACYRVKRTQDQDDGSDTWSFTKLWIKGYPYATGCLCWDDKNDTLYVGFDEGRICRLKVKDSTFVEVSVLS